ncbi:MAG: HlyD family efflux transporter periplasmic adaptor subunit [Streptosporangiaceae bacterium]
MRTTAGKPADEVAGPLPAHAGRPKRRRRKLVAAGMVIVVAAGAVALGVTDAFRGSSAEAAPGPEATALATVTRRSLSSQTQVNATLGYAGSYSVVALSAAGGGSEPSGAGASQPGGSSSAAAFTALPDPGQVVRQGQSLYSVNQSPAILLHGAVPAYRTLSEGTTGTDVRQLNADLVALKDATSSQLDPHSSYFSAATASALDSLQAKLGVAQTGSLALGQAVFLPTAARVTSVSATVGSPAQPGAQVLQASSTTRQVTAQLDATQQSDVMVGDRVSITLPDNRTTPGVVTSVGTVATTPSSGSGGGSGSSSSSSSSSGSESTPTIEVDVKPTDRSATGPLDQAPVQVTITTGTADNALVVPVDALIARASGGYAVEVAGDGGSRRIVPVSLGLFDDADGLVQVNGTAPAAGQSVVVPKL